MTEQEMKELEVTQTELDKNREIEKTYRDAVQPEIPNLWNRIEEALPEKAPKKKKISKFQIYRTSALIAACLCCIILIPVVLSFGGHKNMETAAPAADEAPMAEAEMAEAPAAEADMAEAPVAEADMAEAPQMDMEENAAADTEDRNKTNSMNEDTDTLYTPDVNIEILDYQEEMGDTKEEGYQIVTIKIIEDPSGLYEPDMKFNVYVSDAEAATLATGDTKTAGLVLANPQMSTIPCIYMILNPEK